MKHSEITDALELLKEEHFKVQKVEVPIINSMLYTSLGQQLFDLYQKYEIGPEDQRNLERLSFLLISFTLKPDHPKSLRDRLCGLFKR